MRPERQGPEAPANPGPAAAPGPGASPQINQELSKIRHDLRTPINHILGYAEMLLEETELPASFREDLNRIHSGGRQLLNLIQQYFGDDTFRQIPDRHQLYHELRTPVNHIIGYSELLTDEAADKQWTHLIPDLDRVREAAQKWLLLCEQYLLHHPMHGTTAATESAPVAQPVDPPATRAYEGDRELDPVADTGTLLVVDDDEVNRQMLARRLERRGYSVTMAADGEQALRLVSEQSFDLILLDLIMPGTDGLTVLRRVRERFPGAELPVIMVTGLDSSRDVVDSLQAGANDFVTKPVDFSAALARIRTQLSLKRSQEELKRRMAEVRRLAADLEMRNMFIRQIFGRYVTEDVVESLLETPDGLALGGEKRTVTVLMSDLRGFSTLAERLAPERVVELLNIYLGAMAEVIGRYGGMIDEFIGDAILAVFGAPVWREDHARRAVACALSMQLAMDEVNARVHHLGVTKLEMGIGIHTGEVIVGNIGSTKRAKYGVVGSNVNLAARIEAATVGGEVIISEATASMMRPLLKVDRQFAISAKGARAPVQLFSVIGLGGSYNLNLPHQTERFVKLTTRLPVECFLMTESKQSIADAFAAELTALSTKGATLRCSSLLEASQNLRLRIEGIDRVAGSWDVYVKVLRPAEVSGTWVIRYTSIPPEADQRLRALAGLL